MAFRKQLWKRLLQVSIYIVQSQMVIVLQVNFRLLGNMINKIFIIFFSLSFTFCSVGTNAGEWLEIDTGIRSIGMGTAQTASGRGISSTTYNPANLAFLDKQDFLIVQIHCRNVTRIYGLCNTIK